MPPEEETVRSRQNPLFKRLRALKERGTARDGGGALCLLEGPRLVAEALSAEARLVEVAVAPGAEEDVGVGSLLAELEERRVPVRRLSRSLVASLSEATTTQGLLALAERTAFNEADLYRGTPLIVVAAGIQDPGNLGGLLRTAEAAGASGAYLCDGCADPFSWKALRGSMGSAFRLPHIRIPETAVVLARLESRGVRSFAAVAATGVRYDEVDLAKPVALVIGNEGAGLPDDVVRGTSGAVRVPIAPPVESLNVGVAAGLLLFEAARQRGFPSCGGGR